MNILSKVVGFSLLVLVLLAGCDPSGSDSGVTVGVEYNDSVLLSNAVVAVIAVQGISSYTGSVAATVNGSTTTTTVGFALDSASKVGLGNSVPFVVSLDGAEVANTNITQPFPPVNFGGVTSSTSASAPITITWNDLFPDPEFFQITVTEKANPTVVAFQATDLAGSATSQTIPPNTFASGTEYRFTIMAVNRQSISGDGLAEGSFLQASSSNILDFTLQP